MDFKEWSEKYYPRESKYVLQRMSHAWASGHVGIAMRLIKIAEIIEAVDQRCMAADGPVTPTLQEMTQAEMSEIYELASIPHDQQINSDRTCPHCGGTGGAHQGTCKVFENL